MIISNFGKKSRHSSAQPGDKSKLTWMEKVQRWKITHTPTERTLQVTKVLDDLVGKQHSFRTPCLFRQQQSGVAAVKLRFQVKKGEVRGKIGDEPDKIACEQTHLTLM